MEERADNICRDARGLIDPVAEAARQSALARGRMAAKIVREATAKTQGMAFSPEFLTKLAKVDWEDLFRRKPDILALTGPAPEEYPALLWSHDYKSIREIGPDGSVLRRLIAAIYMRLKVRIGSSSRTKAG